ncbi:hypothetical protein ACX0HA_08900 [Flavobacterium hauense]
MSALFAKVASLPVICGIELAFAGSFLPSTLEGYQTFFNTIVTEASFQEAYFGRASVGFSEESELTNAGYIYKQKLVITFPSGGSSRAVRLDTIVKAKFIKIKLSDNRHLLMGRNDFEQNVRPKIQAKTDERIGQIQFETVSISPLGYTPPVNEGGLPAFIPINLFEE